MKIYEIIEYSDGGPNDKGTITGYIKTEESRNHLKAKINHNFIDYNEISEKEFLEKKKKAEDNLKMFNI
jgi:hypothetical protein